MSTVLSVEQPVKSSQQQGRCLRKNAYLGALLDKVKLWPSRTGILHGIRSLRVKGGFVEFVTHCGQRVKIRDSRKSRAARWLRNKWVVRSCRQCRIPAWKMEKFARTTFR